MEDLSQITLSDVNVKNTNIVANSFFDEKNMLKYVDEYLLFSNNNKRNIIENFKKSQIKRGFVSSVNSTVGGGKSNIVTIVNNFNFGKDNNFKILNIKSK